MDAEKIREKAKAASDESDDEQSLVKLKMLALEYLSVPDDQDQHTTEYLLSRILMVEAETARRSVEKYDRGTRPVRIIGAVITALVLAGGFILWVPIDGRKDTWLTILILGLAWVCLFKLPSWRKTLPRMREALHTFTSPMPAEITDPAVLEKKIMARAVILTGLIKARYKNPFLDETEELIRLL